MRPNQQETMRHHAATAHQDAAPRTKRYAALLGVTDRSARRHASTEAAKGSPLYRHFEYLSAVDDPWRIEAATRTHVIQGTLKKLTEVQLVDLIHELLVQDAHDEGADHAAKASRNTSFAERAVIAERDATTDLNLAAAYREAAERKLSVADVFGGRS